MGGTWHGGHWLSPTRSSGGGGARPRARAPRHGAAPGVGGPQGGQPPPRRGHLLAAAGGGMGLARCPQLQQLAAGSAQQQWAGWLASSRIEQQRCCWRWPGAGVLSSARGCKPAARRCQSHPLKCRIPPRHRPALSVGRMSLPGTGCPMSGAQQNQMVTVSTVGAAGERERSMR